MSFRVCLRALTYLEMQYESPFIRDGPEYQAFLYFLPLN